MVSPFEWPPCIYLQINGINARPIFRPFQSFAKSEFPILRSITVFLLKVVSANAYKSGIKNMFKLGIIKFIGLKFVYLL